ncbi:MAG: hypothetical protein WD016_07865 [Balneolaceae bacterium]
MNANRRYTTNTIAKTISVARAQFFLLGLMLSLKDHTSSIIKLTIGINEITTVITHSFSGITTADISLCTFSINTPIRINV